MTFALLAPFTTSLSHLGVVSTFSRPVEFGVVSTLLYQSSNRRIVLEKLKGETGTEKASTVVSYAKGFALLFFSHFSFPHKPQRFGFLY